MRYYWIPEQVGNDKEVNFEMGSNWPTNFSSRAKLATGYRKLGEVCEINMGQSPVSSTYNSSQNDIPTFSRMLECRVKNYINARSADFTTLTRRW